MGNKASASACVGRRILIVDDDPLVRRSIARMLCSSFETVAVPGAMTAFAALDAGERFDFILLDMNLGSGMGGREAYERAFARYATGVTIVIMSGELPPDDAFGRAVATSWIMKPFRKEELLAFLERCHGHDGTPAAA